MAPETTQQDRALTALENLEHASKAIGASIAFAESARDALNREPPAREVAVAITAAEDAQHRLDAALRGMHGRPVPAPGDEWALITRPDPATIHVTFADGSGLALGEDGLARPLPVEYAPPSVVAGDFDGPREA